MILGRKKELLFYNSYKIRVEADYFIEVENKKKYADFYKLFKFIKKQNIKKYFVLGSGANVIFKNNFYDGIIIKLKSSFMVWESENRVIVDAGSRWDEFLEILQRKSERENRRIFYDIQSLSSIPGTVGAGVFGNIGAFGTEIKKYVAGVEYFDIEENKVIYLDDYKKFNFSYRNSFFKINKDKIIILKVVFDFSRKFIKKIEEFYKEDEYFSLEHFSKKYNLGKIKKTEIRKNIIKVRKNIYPDIKKYPNIGSTFKNTEISEKQFKIIIEKYPNIPHWFLENKRVKIPTAYIFDKILNLNGKVFGNIKIDETRPLFFLNMGGATGEEFFNLCQKIKKDVKEKLDIEIEEEVIYVE